MDIQLRSRNKAEVVTVEEPEPTKTEDGQTCEEQRKELFLRQRGDHSPEIRSSRSNIQSRLLYQHAEAAERRQKTETSAEVRLGRTG